jgi:uncharacterized protein (TIGR02453 family)
MTEPASFRGFTKDTVRFYTELTINNNREWFARNKDLFEREVIGPAKLFVVALGGRLKTIAPGLLAVPAVNKSIFRIYRDTRFSLDPTPYKTNLGIYFWEGAHAKMEAPGFYFQLEPPHILFGGGMYQIPESLLVRYRRAVVDPKRGGELRRIVDGIRRLPGFEIGGETYKRVPAGFDPAHPGAELLKRKGLWAGCEMRVPEEFYTAALVDFCFERYEKMAPLYRWMLKLFQPGPS